MTRPKPFKYHLKNKEKYSGDPNNIVMRSSWEARLARFCDLTESVIAWGSEHKGTVIPYLSPVDSKVHSYYPDFIIKLKKPDGTVKMVLVEVKPHAETIQPKEPKKKTRKAMQSYKNAVRTYMINTAKWSAARAWCAQKGFEFLIMTEFELGLAQRPG